MDMEPVEREGNVWQKNLGFIVAVTKCDQNVSKVFRWLRSPHVFEGSKGRAKKNPQSCPWGVDKGGSWICKPSHFEWVMTRVTDIVVERQTTSR